jgi:hypothetical protein
MENKQTSVEWLVEQVEDFIGLIPVDIIEQAKEMERHQIIIAYDMGDRDVRYQPEQYYEQTYGGKDGE